MLDILFVGCGSMGNTWMKDILERPDCRVVGLCDINPAHSADYASRYHLSCPRYDNIKSALESCKSDLVVDCTTPESHEEITVASLEAGCHVMGEKPMASGRSGALRQIEAARRTGRSYAVMQNRIYLPHMRSLKAAVQNGTLGRIGFLSADFFIGAHFGGFRDEMANPLILDMAVHTFYQARFILGGRPKSVYCYEFNPAGSWYKGNASAIAIFEWEDGAVFEYRGSWCAEGMNTSWECDWRLIGECGTIKWDGASAPKGEIADSSEGFIRRQAPITLTSDWTGRSGHEGCFDEMHAALRENRPAETSCEENYISMNMVYAAIESAAAGAKVAIKY